MIPLPVTLMGNSSSSYNKAWNILDLSTYYDHQGITEDGVTFGVDAGFCGGPFAYSKNSLGDGITFNNVGFEFGDSGSNNVVTAGNFNNVGVPNKKCDYVYVLAAALLEDDNISFQVRYTDNTTVNTSQVSDRWVFPVNLDNKVALIIDHSNFYNGGPAAISNYIYCHIFNINRNKEISTISIGNYGGNTGILAVTQVSNAIDLEAWYKADAIVGWPLSSGPSMISITTWADSSGNSHDLTSVGSSYPILSQQNINGYPSVGFNENTAMRGIINCPRSKFSVFTIFKETVPGTFMLATSWGGEVMGPQMLVWQGYFVSESGGENGCLVVGSDSNHDIFNPDANQDTEWHLAELTFSNGTMSGWDTGVSHGSYGFEGNRSGDAFYLGDIFFRGLPLIGDIVEVLVFKTGLNDNSRKVIEQYLNGKYSLDIE